MRLICTLHNQNDAKKLSDYLTVKKINNEVDGQINGDWGSSEYGTVSYKIWVVEEDQAQEAYAIYKDFLEHPEDQRFNAVPVVHKATPPPPPPPLTMRASNRGMPPVTRLLLLTCCILFAWMAWSAPSYKSEAAKDTVTPIYTSPVQIDLLYDYPQAYAILAKLVENYGIDALENPAALPPEGQNLVHELQTHPYWQGFYDQLLDWILNKSSNTDVSWFEKIRQGEIWRLFSPILLHGDIFHLMFNMIWLYVLGKQLEINLGALRYIIFILIAAAVSNTAQYLMSGPNFVGFSGVLCAMLTFIWRRQVEAPWEGYQLLRVTFIFIMIFIVGMAVLQLIAFIVEALTAARINTVIANTAHITGALVGLLLSRIKFFTNSPKVSD